MLVTRRLSSLVSRFVWEGGSEEKYATRTPLLILARRPSKRAIPVLRTISVALSDVTSYSDTERLFSTLKERFHGGGDLSRQQNTLLYNEDTGKPKFSSKKLELKLKITYHKFDQIYAI